MFRCYRDHSCKYEPEVNEAIKSIPLNKSNYKNLFTMKNLTKSAIAMMIFTVMVYNSSAQTIKERIDEAKTVKVYVSIKDIIHAPNTNAAPGSQQKGTGCVNFTQTTPFTSDYADVVKQIVDALNKGFNTTAFVAGDISTVPLFESGIQKGSQDYLKLGEPVLAVVYLTGTYNVLNAGLMGEVSLSANFNIMSGINIYAVTDGKLKGIALKNLGMVNSPAKQTKTCPDYDYFVKNFPLADYFEKFKTSFETKTTDFITKEMENYDKAMKKKK